MDYERELINSLETLMFESMFCGFLETTKEPLKTVDTIFSSYKKTVIKVINHKIDDKVTMLNASAKSIGIDQQYDAENIRVDMLKALKRIENMYWKKFRDFAKQVEDSRGY